MEEHLGPDQETSESGMALRISLLLILMISHGFCFSLTVFIFSVL